VRVRAVSLNYRDLMIAWGQYPIPSDPPPIAVADGAGEVIAIGPQVTRFKVGDHVAIPYYPDWIDGEPTAESVHRVPGATIDGMPAEEIVVPEDVLISVPSWLEFTEAATLPCAGVTAWNALFIGGAVKPGNTVLLLGTGGRTWHARDGSRRGRKPVRATESFRDGCDAFKDAKLRWPSVRSLDRPPGSPRKPT